MKNNKLKYILFLWLIISQCVNTVSAQNNIDAKIDKLLSKMTLEEKLGQMNQLSFDVDNTDLSEKVKKGFVGSLLNIVDPDSINYYQKIAVERSHLGIPLIIGRDVIHGFKTIFPIPLGQAATFNPDLVETGARISAIEASSSGVRWTFAPMLDIARDPRWGRIAESFGEDPYLASQLGVAMVRGFQGTSLSDPTSIAACVKHFIGYGAAEGGRDYNTTNIPPHLMQNIYLPSFHSAINAGAATLMTSFNENDGIPASANKYMLRNLLRDEWRFDGFVVSDWESIREMIPHGFARDRKDAAMLSANAGVDMEMVSGTYLEYLPELLKEGKVSEKVIDDAVRNILRIKFRLGLFEHPYADTSKKSVMYKDEYLIEAREAAVESAVLLKNENNLLPLNKKTKIALIGPMANAPHDQLGTWVFDGEKTHTVTPLKALETEYSNIKYVYEPALTYSRDTNKTNFSKAVEAVKKSDVAVVVLGEESILSGEAHSLTDLNLIGVQSELLQAVKSVGKPVILVIVAGRPLTIERDLANSDAVLYCFHPGTMGGPALWDLVFGKKVPSGKLPVSFVKNVGQIPYFYNHNNTGRPAPAQDEIKLLDKIPLEAGQTSLGNTSHYLDIGKAPLFPFGYGLSYTTFEYSNIRLNKRVIEQGENIDVTFTLKNTGNYDAVEVAQLYIQDVTASLVRPVKELKNFARVMLKAGESKEITFTLKPDALKFYNIDNKYVSESGDFNVWVGGNSDATLQTTFELK